MRWPARGGAVFIKRERAWATAVFLAAAVKTSSSSTRPRTNYMRTKRKVPLLRESVAKHFDPPSSFCPREYKKKKTRAAQIRQANKRNWKKKKWINTLWERKRIRCEDGRLGAAQRRTNGRDSIFSRRRRRRRRRREKQVKIGNLKCLWKMSALKDSIEHVIIISNRFPLASDMLVSVSRPISACTYQLGCVTGQGGNRYGVDTARRADITTNGRNPTRFDCCWHRLAARRDAFYIGRGCTIRFRWLKRSGARKLLGWQKATSRDSSILLAKRPSSNI